MFVDEHAHLGRCGSSAVAKKNRGGLEDLVGAPQLLDLAVERLQPLALVAGEQIGSLALVGFGLADPAAQRLALDAEVLGDLGDRSV
jgi:hypothetical protein